MTLSVRRSSCSLPLHFSLVCGLVFTLVLAARADTLRVMENMPVEIELRAGRSHADPFNEVTVDVVFTDPDGRQWRVPAFWAGGDVWKARYASARAGKHRYRSECSDSADRGLHGVKGQVEITSYTGDNPLFRHGPLRIAPDRRHLEHADGTPFFWLGDTWWMGLCHRLRWPDEFRTLTADRKAKGFNVIQIVAGLYPDMPAFDPRGANEAGFPWEEGYARIRPEYFDAADRRIRHLVDEGLTPCIVGAWGYYLPWMGPEKMQRHWRYLIARWGAWPVVWCVAGEANLPWYLAKGFPFDDRAQAAGWTEIMRYVRRTDPFHRPVTIHPTAIGRYTARHVTDDDRLLDFDMLQTPHGRQEAVPVAIQAVRESVAAAPMMPVINGEASYEMLGDALPTQWTRAMFWHCLMNGAAGHTYGANGIWQCNRRDQPHGASPHGGSYGVIPWDDAMRLPGSFQVGAAKRLLERYPWHRFRHHPEWAAFNGGAQVSLEESRWIWFPEGDPARDAPAEARYFRLAFEIPSGRPVIQARLRVTADDRATVRLNGAAIGASEDWHTGAQWDVTARLREGSNVLAIVAENKLAAVSANPAGLIAGLEIRFANGETLRLRTDSSWRCARRESAGWDTAVLDDSAWDRAREVARHGDAPWGRIEAQSEYDGPQSAGIPGRVRLTYAPRAEAVLARHLGFRAAYRAAWFDPVTGETTALGEARADDDGNWTCPPPSGVDHDWVLILEAVDGENGASEDKQPSSKAEPGPASSLILANEHAEWRFAWDGGTLRAVCIENRRAGHAYHVSRGEELSLTFSAAPDRLAEPIRRVTGFAVTGARRVDAQHVVFDLRCDAPALDIALHVQLDGPTRRKWVEVTNRSGEDLLLLDVVLDDLSTDGDTAEGGAGQPVFLEDAAFAVVEHPAGVNEASDGRFRLLHHPGRRLPPGASLRSHASLVSMAMPGQARSHFVSYLQEKSLRKKQPLAVYTPFGINNQWGACPTLDDEQTLDVLRLLEGWQRRGVRFDYFTLDTGWVDPGSDLTEFKPTSHPNGPGKIVKRVNALGMRFGLWFALGWGTQSCWDYPAAFADGNPPGLPYREGYPLTVGGLTFCLGTDRYYNILKNAVLRHVRENHVRFLKFDGGIPVCDDPAHGHLPGVYGLEAMYDRLIDIADSARAVAPDTFVMWYWGLQSPFWALYGDTIFESGLHLEGSGTSSTPTLYYRDSVTLAQDQNAQHARNIPPCVKDSLGVWLADTRWGNFMGPERWREALVMDMGRGSLLFPNLWGNLYHLTGEDVRFLARMSALARKNAALLLRPRHLLGSAWQEGPYGYGYFDGAHGLVFLSNVHFAARPVELPLGSEIGLETQAGTVLRIDSHFPDRCRVTRADGSAYRSGERVTLWLRPFETLLLEVRPASGRSPAGPLRRVGEWEAAGLGTRLPLARTDLSPRMALRFADASRFEQMGFAQKVYAYESALPSLDGDQPILAVAIRLRRGGGEWRYAPKPVEIVQALARVGDRNVPMIPVPDGRQYGNTQRAGCSWVLYKTRLNPQWSGRTLQVAVHAYLPEGVEAQVEAWVVKRWWEEGTRPVSDGYYADAPS